MDVCSNGADRQGGAPNPTVGGYYGLTAYRPDSVPDQPAQQQDFNHSALRRSASFRVPWGGAQDVMPANL